MTSSYFDTAGQKEEGERDEIPDVIIIIICALSFAASLVRYHFRDRHPLLLLSSFLIFVAQR
jgi:hypothetical protein